MTRYRVSHGVLRAELDGEEVLLNPDTGVYHLVNATGRAVLERWESGSSLEEAAHDLAREMDESPGHVEEDVRGFADALLERGLIEVDE